MLINFSFSNFKSYRDEQQFSMQRPANAQKHEEGDWKRKDISTVAGVYGGNASGKSAFFDAFQFVASYIVNGFNPNFDIGALFQPFRLDEMTRSGKSEFLVDFLGTNDTRYIYELSIMGGKIDYESLRAYNGNRTNRIYERERSGGSYSYKYGRTFSGAKKTYEQMARPETPYISVLYAANAAIVQPAYEFFRNRVGFYRADLFDRELSNIRIGLKKGTPTAKALATLMANTDLGISVVQTKDLLDELQESSQQPGDPRYKFSFMHRGKDGFEESFTEGEESRGTLAVLAFFSLALKLLSCRSVGFIDEVDSSLHPNYVQELVALFKDPRTNPHQSQLIFTTHDVSLIIRTGADPRILDQDQIWLVEKAVDGSSSLYPVTSIPSRWDENFGRNYLHGIYGAAPRPDFHEAFVQAAKDLQDAHVELTAEKYGVEA